MPRTCHSACLQPIRSLTEASLELQSFLCSHLFGETAIPHDILTTQYPKTLHSKPQTLSPRRYGARIAPLRSPCKCLTETIVNPSKYPQNSGIASPQNPKPYKTQASLRVVAAASRPKPHRGTSRSGTERASILPRI